MGLFSSKKTITDLTIVNVFQPDVAMHHAKKTLLWQTDSIQSYNTGMFYWKKEFRASMKPSFLKNSGFSPETRTSMKVLSNEKLLTYIKSNVDSTAVSVLKSSISVPDPDEIGRWYFETNGYDWCNDTNTLIYNGNTYTTYDAEFLIVYSEEDSESEYDALNNRSIDYSKVKITVTMYGINPKEFVIDNPWVDTECVIAVYEKDDTTKRHFIDVSDVIPDDAYTFEEIILTPVIVIKKDNKFPKQTLKVKRILNKYGLNGKQLIDDLSGEDAKEIDNAYLWEGLPFRSPYISWDEKQDCDNAPQIPQYYHHRWRKKNNYHAEALFKTFDYYSRTTLKPIGVDGSERDEFGHIGAFNMSSAFRSSGPLSFNLGDINSSYSFSIEKTFHDGNANDIHREKCPYDETFDENGHLNDDYNNDDENEQTQRNIVSEGFFDSIHSNSSSRCRSGCNTMGRGGCSIIFGDPTCPQPSGPPFKLKKGEYYSELVPHLLYGDNNGKDKTEENEHPEKPAGSKRSQLYIYHQIDDEHYVVMRIYDYVQHIKISGHGFRAYLDSLPEEGRIILPLDVVRDLRFNAYYTTHEFSLSIICYAEKTVEVSWWAKLLNILMIVLAIVFAPAGAMLQVIINLVIGLAVNFILSQIDNPILRFLVGMILGGLSNFVASGFNFSALTIENFLPSAQDLIGLASEIYQQSLKEKAEEARKEKMQEQWNERDRKYFSELNSMPKIMPVLRVENQLGDTYDMLGPEMFYRRMYGEPLWSYGTLYDIDTAINQRITVKSG